MEMQLEGEKSKGYKTHEGRTHLCFVVVVVVFNQ